MSPERTARFKSLLPQGTAGRALLVAAIVAVAGGLVWYATRGIEIIEGESVVELADVEPASRTSIEQVTLKDVEQRLPGLRFSNATLTSSEQHVRHGYGLFPVFETTIVDSTTNWSVRPQDGVSQEDAVESLVSQTRSQLTEMLQRDMETERSEDGSSTSIRPKSQPSDDNPYWFTSSIQPSDDGTIGISITLSTQPPGTFDYTASDLVPDEHVDKIALMKPLTDIDGIMLYDFTVTDRGAFRVVLEQEHDNDANTTEVNCDEYAEAFVKVTEAFQQYDPTAVRDDEAFDGATFGVEGERWIDGGQMAAHHDGEAIRFNALATCLPTNTLDLAGSVLTVNFWAE